jgi:predicted Zn finger-like uncharacterized protein
MSMATRCVACGTIFRVVQDQLKVSDGWVRCGRCDHVFNALEGLFDLEREAPPPWQPGGFEQTAAQREAGFEKTAADLDEDDRIASRFFRPEQEDVAKTPAEAVAERDRMDFEDAQFPTEMLGEEGEGNGVEAPMPAARAKAKSRGRSKSKSKARSKPPTGPEEPGFVRHAEREARWRTPTARLMLSLSALVLLVMLGSQVGLHFRDTFAARWPQTLPLLTSWCGWLQCSIQAPRRIEDVTVESSTLTNGVAGTETFKLALTVRNRGTLPVSMPSIELSLTDGSGALVARRALAPADFRASGAVLAPGSETPLQLLLSTGSPRVAGYTVEAFYP